MKTQVIYMNAAFNVIQPNEQKAQHSITGDIILG